MKFLLALPLLGLLAFNKPGQPINTTVLVNTHDTTHLEGETHFKNVRQLTFGGDNAEAYFSYDGKYLVYQRTDVKNGIPCDQIWMGKIPENANEAFVPKLVSTGTGRTTCAYFYPDGKHIVYGSTHLGSKDCHRCPIEKNMAIDTFGPSIPASIFLKPIPMAKL